MLKIKDNVDLTELEKFGFVKKDWYYCFNYEYDPEDNWLYVIISSREIQSEPDFRLDYKAQDIIFEKLFDLIQAGLVEKVD